MIPKHLLKPTQLKEIAEAAGLNPSKHYGQHYLIQEKAIQAMLDAADLQKDDTVIEIGPGFGVITLAMAQQVNQVIALEIEQTLQTYWQEQQEMYTNIEMKWGNAISLFPKIIQEQKEPYKVVANLPYQITSHIVRLMLEAEKQPERIVLMVQKEVAERICAPAGEKSLLSVSVQWYCLPKIVQMVPSGAFWPSPDVDSAVIQFTGIHKPENSEAFFKIVKAAFAQKRKTLVNNLAGGLKMEKSVLMELLSSLEINPKIRPQSLTMEQWRLLCKKLSTQL